MCYFTDLQRKAEANPGTFVCYDTGSWGTYINGNYLAIYRLSTGQWQVSNSSQTFNSLREAQASLQ